MLLIERLCTTHYAFKPRLVVPKHSLRRLREISFVPIKGNRILLFAGYLGNLDESYLHLSIHEIQSDNRVGPALWSFDGSVNYPYNVFDLESMKTTKNAMGITLGVQSIYHLPLFDISTSDTDANDFPLIESGRIHFNSEWMLWNSLGLSEIFSCVEHALMCNPSQTITSQAHSPKCGFRAKTTQ